MEQDNNVFNNNSISNTAVGNNLNVTSNDSSIINNAISDEGKNNKNNSKKFIIIGVIAAVIILLVVLVVIFSKGRSSNETKKKEDIETNFKDIGLVFLYEDENDTYYYVDGKNKTYTFEGYSSMVELPDDYFIVKKDNKYGVIDKDEKEIINFGIYDEIETAYDDELSLLEVEKDDKYGVIDFSGKEIVPIEYDDVHTIYFSGLDLYVFYVAKDGKFFYLSSSGKYLMDTEEVGYWGSYDVKTYIDEVRDDYDYLILINESKFFNARTGEEVNITPNEYGGVNFKYNIWYEQYKGYTIFDKNLKVKEVVSKENLTGLEVYKVLDKYIVVVEEYEENRKENSKYRIFDLDYKLLKEVDCPNIRTLTVEETNGKYFSIIENGTWAGNLNHNMTIYDADLKSKYVETKFSRDVVVDNSGNTLLIDEDYSGKVVTLYDFDLKEKFKKENYRSEKFINDMLVLQDMSKYVSYDVFNLNGEKLFSGYDDWSTLYSDFENDKVFLMLETDYRDYELVLNEKTKLYNKGYYWSLMDGKVISSDLKTNNNLKVYDYYGELLNDIKDVEEYDIVSDRYMYIFTAEKGYIYDAKKNKNVFEFDVDRYVEDLQYKGLDIVQLDDGFYTYEGKLVLSLEK